LFIVLSMSKEYQLGKVLNDIDKGLDEVEDYFYSFEKSKKLASSTDGEWVQPKVDISNMKFYESLINMNFAAYCPSKNLKSWNCSFCKASGLKLTNVETYTDRKNMDAAFVGVAKDFNVLVFRGTGSTTKRNAILSWGDNFLAAKYKWPRNVVGSLVHSGFFLSWRNLRQTTFDKVSRLPKGKPLVITGYSRGGAFAIFAAIELKKLGYQIRDVVTFGQPKVGNREFVRAFLKLYPNGIKRFVHNRDLVPHLPPAAMKFEHISNEIYQVDGKYEVCRVNERQNWLADPKCSTGVNADRLSIQNHHFYLGFNSQTKC